MRRWKVDPEDLIVMTMSGEVVERGAYPGAASTLQCLMLFRAFPASNAILHTHSQGCLTYAALGRPIPPAITSFDKFGEIPCITCDDQDLKARFKAAPWPVELPEAMLARPDVAAVGEWVANAAVQALESQSVALDRRCLAFTMYRHGVVVFGKSMERAVQDLTSIEANANIALRTALLSAAMERSLSPSR